MKHVCWIRLPKASRTVLLLLVLSLVGAACDDDPVAPPAEVVGVYTLTSINGGPLPFTWFSNATTTIEFVSGALLLRENGDFRFGFDTLTTPAEGEPEAGFRETIGHFEVNGSRITFREPDGNRITGTISAGIVTFDQPLPNDAGTFMATFEKTT